MDQHAIRRRARSTSDPTAGGLALGAAAAFGVTRFAEFLLYGISPTDPATFLGIALVLTAAALTTYVIPARRARKADPM